MPQVRGYHDAGITVIASRIAGRKGGTCKIHIATSLVHSKELETLSLAYDNIVHIVHGKVRGVPVRLRPWAPNLKLPAS
ncbi:MAG: hypothetical protein LWX01_10160 [Deltaproteobacteria bacterium]|nr:hypothetical protein [Deltaproteobacteria bacterium]